jgi:hypothetical protein
MQSRPNDQFQPFIESVEDIVSVMKRKERYIEELNTPDLPDISEVIKEKRIAFESMFNSLKEDRYTPRLTDDQKKLFEKVVEDTNLGIESSNLKVIRDSIRDLESFRDRLINS